MSRCSRCHGQSCPSAKECKNLTFLREKTVAEKREDRLRAQSNRKGQEEERLAYEARKQQRAERREEWEAKQQRWAARQQKFADHASRALAKQEDWECSSQATTSTAMTAALTPTPEDEEALRCKFVEADKDVRRLQKKLREIVQLEACNSLDALQKAKLERKHDIEIELRAARGRAWIMYRFAV